MNHSARVNPDARLLAEIHHDRAPRGNSFSFHKARRFPGGFTSATARANRAISQRFVRLITLLAIELDPLRAAAASPYYCATSLDRSREAQMLHL